MNFISRATLLLAGVAAAALIERPALAATPAPDSQSAAASAVGEVIVTARKREEASIAVPVSITAVSHDELARRDITNLDTVSRLVPGLLISESGGTAQGGELSLRGISAADSNNLGDSAVSFDIDGVSVARVSVRRLASFDMQQVAVLKGPQTLFYGRDSPGGVISIQTADPTSVFHAGVTQGYEGVAQEWRTEAYVSAPLTDTLGVRVAYYRSSMRGWSQDIVPSNSPFAPTGADKWLPNGVENDGRITLKWNPNSRFDANLKISYGVTNGTGSYSNQQIIFCPLGVAQQDPVAACKPGNTNTVGMSGPALAALIPSLYRDGNPYQHESEFVAGLRMNYRLTDYLTVSSTTGVYQSQMDQVNNFSTGYNPATVGIAYFLNDDREFSQDVVLNSSFNGPVNFTLGGDYRSSKGASATRTAFNSIKPTGGSQAYFRLDGTAASVYGQVRWLVIPTVELAIGGRASTESKNLSADTFLKVGAGMGVGGGITGFGPAVPVLLSALPSSPLEPRLSDTWKNFSPEATLTWRPTDNLTVFGAYRSAFLSGGFATVTYFTNNEYRPELVNGGEVGLKALLLDKRLRVEGSVYYYKMKNQQVTDAVQINGVGIPILTNAGGANLPGAEASFDYRTPIAGLNLHADIAYEHARYTSYFAQCYTAQPQPSCPAPAPSLLNEQNLKGAPLARAPDWNGTAGFDYSRPIGTNLKFSLSGDLTFSSSYFTSADDAPDGLQKAYELLDVTVGIGAPDDRWRLSFIGRDLNNAYYVDRSLSLSFTGGLSGSSTSPTPADYVGSVSRGRELWVSLALKY